MDYYAALRASIYGVAAAILAALVTHGIVRPDHADVWRTVLDATLGLVMLLAFRYVGPIRQPAPDDDTPQ